MMARIVIFQKDDATSTLDEKKLGSNGAIKVCDLPVGGVLDGEELGYDGGGIEKQQGQYGA